MYGDACTSNAFEGWNRGFLTSVSSIGPNFWRFFDDVKDSFVLTHTRITELCQSAPTIQKRKLAKSVDSRYQQLVKDYSLHDDNSRTLDRRKFLLDISDLIALLYDDFLSLHHLRIVINKKLLVYDKLTVIIINNLHDQICHRSIIFIAELTAL